MVREPATATFWAFCLLNHENKNTRDLEICCYVQPWQGILKIENHEMSLLLKKIYMYIYGAFNIFLNPAAKSLIFFFFKSCLPVI